MQRRDDVVRTWCRGGQFSPLPLGLGRDGRQSQFPGPVAACCQGDFNGRASCLISPPQAAKMQAVCPGVQLWVQPWSVGHRTCPSSHRPCTALGRCPPASLPPLHFLHSAGHCLLAASTSPPTICPSSGVCCGAIETGSANACRRARPVPGPPKDDGGGQRRRGSVPPSYVNSQNLSGNAYQETVCPLFHQRHLHY